MFWRQCSSIWWQNFRSADVTSSLLYCSAHKPCMFCLYIMMRREGLWVCRAIRYGQHGNVGAYCLLCCLAVLTWDSSSSHLLSLTAAQAHLWCVPPPLSKSAAHLAATDTPTNALQLLMSLDLEQRTGAQPSLLQPAFDKLSASSAIIWQHQQQLLIWLCTASGAIACLLQPQPGSKTADISKQKPARHVLQHHKVLSPHLHNTNKLDPPIVECAMSLSRARHILHVQGTPQQEAVL